VLREARESANLSQQEAALNAGMDRAYISEVENGKRSLSVDRLLRLCAAIGVQANEIVSKIERQLSTSR
jgi:transcriptional regulator with XRE-family HTH domain